MAKYSREYYSDGEYEEMQAHLDREAAEASQWLKKSDEVTKKAAGYLNREFPETPVQKWIAALNNPEMVMFTDSHKEARYDAAQNWINQEMKKIQ